MEANQPTEGWGTPTRFSAAHYFGREDKRSLCGRWLRVGDLSDEHGRWPCKACTRALAKRAARAS